MKVYSVKPGSFSVRVSDGRTLTGRGDIGWGDGTMGAMYLAHIILLDVLGDDARATKLMQRFKWRTIVTWPKDAPNAITEEEVLLIVEDIERTAREHAPMIARQQRERPDYVSDRAGPDQGWDSAPDLIRKKPNDITTKSNGGTAS